MIFLLEGQETARILFRQVRRTDFNNWLPFFKEPKAWEHWICERKDPEIACQEWYEKQLYRYRYDQGGMNALIEKSTGQLIGHCGLLVQNVDDISELEIAYSLLPSYWGQGFASEASRKCRDFAFANRWSSSLVSIISMTNRASQQVAINNGMRVDKTTVYKQNPVQIYRIHHEEWLGLM
mgnify:CR=1 FL=1